MRRTLLVALVLVVAAVPARAASPALGSIAPRGAQRGTEATLTFSGARLADAEEVLTYTPGFTFGKVEPVNANQFKVKVKIAADCRLGERPFRVRTATGVSELHTFWVGNLPVVEEKEPNDEFAK